MSEPAYTPVCGWPDNRAVDDLETLNACWEALGDLMTPDGTLQERERDHVATLVGLLTRLTAQAVEGVTRAPDPSRVAPPRH